MQFFCKSRGPDQMAKQAKDVMNLTYFLLVFVSEQSKKLVDGWKAWKSWRREEKNKTQWKLLQFVVWRHDGKTEFAKKKNKASRLIAGDKSLNLSPRMIEWTILVDEKILPRKFFVTNFFAPQWKMKKKQQEEEITSTKPVLTWFACLCHCHGYTCCLRFFFPLQKAKILEDIFMTQSARIFNQSFFNNC